MTTPPTPTPEKYYVLMMTATVVACDAISPMDAALRAISEAPSVIDPEQLRWVVRHASTTPIELGDDETEAEITAAAEKPRIELIK